MLSWNFFSCAALHTLQFVSKKFKKTKCKISLFHLRNISINIAKTPTLSNKNQEKFLLKRKSAQQQPRPPQRIPKPKPGGGGKFMRNNDRPSNDNFPSRIRPVQFTPIEGGSSGIPYQVIVRAIAYSCDG